MLRGLSQLGLPAEKMRKPDSQSKTLERVKKEISKFRDMAERSRKLSRHNSTSLSHSDDSDDRTTNKKKKSKKSQMENSKLIRRGGKSGYQKSILDNVLHLGEKELKQYFKKGKKSALTIR